MKFRAGATRCSLKQSVGMIVLRLVTPLTMRDERRERREYIKELKRYDEYVKKQQQKEEEEDDEVIVAAPADETVPVPIPNTLDGTTDTPGGVSSGMEKFARNLRKVASKLNPRVLFRRRGRARRESTTTPVQPPRRMPHWQNERPKPLPTWLKRGTQASSAYPVGYRPRPGRGARRSEPRSRSPNQSRASTNPDVRRELLADRENMAEAQTGKTRVVNREDMPPRYRHTNPY